MKRVAVILSGCGFLDGSEVQESVLTLLALDKAGAEVTCFATNSEQMHVVDHSNQEEIPDAKRNVLQEAARIARGEITDIAEANAEEFDALIFPGGFGVAKNLSNFASNGAECEVNSEVLAFARAIAAAKKPIGFICIAPALIPLIYDYKVVCTIGNDAGTAAVLEQMGAVHQECPVDEIVVDTHHLAVSTPAYMLGPSIAPVATGIDKLVNSVLALA